MSLKPSIASRVRNSTRPVTFPRHSSRALTKTVLVKDYVPGNTFDELLTQGRLSYQSLLDLFHIHGFYMFVKGIFHGDIHPGNVILNDGAITFIDTSFIGHVTDQVRINLFISSTPSASLTTPALRISFTSCLRSHSMKKPNCIPR